MELWEAILNDKPDSETRARVNGIDSQMKKFNFYFILSHADNLSKTLQHTTFSAAEGQHAVRLTTTTLQSIKCLTCFGRRLRCKQMNWKLKNQLCQEGVKYQGAMR